MPDQPTVSNSSCLIVLEAIGRLDLLSGLYGSIVIPQAVAAEWGVAAMPPWIQVNVVQNNALVQTLEIQLGPGESEAIALAAESSAVRLILDDKKARRIACSLGLPVMGTIAHLIEAKRRGLIPEVRPILDELFAAGFWLSDELVQEALRLAGE